MRSFLMILILFLFNQCTYNKTEIIEYEGYHDEAKTILGMKGNLVNGKEDGTWDFYDSTGVLEKQGSFKGGLKSGQWLYFKDSFTKEINWIVSNEIEGISFSYPSAFKKLYNKQDTNSTYYFDSLNARIISIRIFKGSLKFNIDSFFSMNLNGFYSTSFVSNAQSDLIKKNDYSYYIDEFNIVEKKTGLEYTVYSFYELIGGNLITITISSKSNLKRSSFNIINEIFGNFWVSDNRVLDAF